MFAPPQSDEIIPIHVAAKPDLDHALCGDKILPRPHVRRTVEIGYERNDGSIVALDDVELEAGWISMLERHPQAVKVGDMCRGCLEKVAKLREKRDRPTKKTTSKAETAARRAERAQQKIQREAIYRMAKANVKAQQTEAWIEKMADDES